MPVVAGAGFRGGTRSSLTKSSIKDDRQSFQLTDRAYGVARTRSVLVNHGEDVMAVLDTVPRGSKVGTIWHFATDLSAASSDGGKVVVKDKSGWKAALVQVAMPSCKPVSSKVVRGATNPYQGWVSPPTCASRPPPRWSPPPPPDRCSPW
nr:hypothetical protein GCM10020093_055930 [Planobispora longispora]